MLLFHCYCLSLTDIVAICKIYLQTIALVADEILWCWCGGEPGPWTFRWNSPVPLPPAEQRLSLAADERKREFHEEKRQEFENYAEEERDGRAKAKPKGEAVSVHVENGACPPQNKTSGAGRALSSGGSFTTTACILPRSTTVTPPEAQEGRHVVNKQTLTDTLVGIGHFLCAELRLRIKLFAFYSQTGRRW